MKLAHLQAVAHDIAHHAVSSVSPLRGVLWRVCQSNGVVAVSFDLLAPPHYPSELPQDAAVARAAPWLGAMFEKLLISRGFVLGDLSAARLSVAFAPAFLDLDLFSSHARLEAGGRLFERAFPLPSDETLRRLRRERGCTLADAITTRDALTNS